MALDVHYSNEGVFAKATPFRQNNNGNRSAIHFQSSDDKNSQLVKNIILITITTLI
jgi:hypothetical protein